MEPRGGRAVAARMRHAAKGHFIPGSLILSRTWLTKPRVVRLTAKGFNSGLLIIRDDQGYELMAHDVVDVKLQRGELKFPHVAVVHEVDHMQRLGIFTVGEDISHICKWCGGKCLPEGPEDQGLLWLWQALYQGSQIRRWPSWQDRSQWGTAITRSLGRSGRPLQRPPRR
jgi:hypothetical protein